MAADNFAAALALVLRHEGGYVDHPRDPGGATNMGVTRASLARWRGRPVSKDDVRRLTRDEAAAIYRARYWDAVGADALGPGLDYALFDAAVHSGPARAVRWLQAALDVPADGRFGPRTRAAAETADPATAVRRVAAIRLDFLRGLGTWRAFGRGWARRVREMEADALAMARAAETTERRPT